MNEWMNLYFTNKHGSKTDRENNLQTVDKNTENKNTQSSQCQRRSISRRRKAGVSERDRT